MRRNNLEPYSNTADLIVLVQEASFLGRMWAWLTDRLTTEDVRGDRQKSKFTVAFGVRSSSLLRPSRDWDTGKEN